MKVVQLPVNILIEILDETYHGHNDECFHCAHVNELLDHWLKENNIRNKILEVPE
jgi:hypothetical protein